VTAFWALLDRLWATHAWRSWERYTDARGTVLACGITYLGFFALAPALILGFTLFGVVLRNQPDLFERVVASVSQTLPGVIRDEQHPNGLLDASNPPTPNALTIAGAVSLATLIFSGLGWAGALREGVRAVFGQPALQDNVLKAALKDLTVLVTFGLAVLLSGVLSTVVSAAGPWVLGLLLIDESTTLGTVLLNVASFAVLLFVDFMIMLYILRLLSGVALPRSDLLQGAVVGAVGLGLLKLASGLLLGALSNRPLLASFAFIVGLLVLINLISRMILLAAAWAATTAHDEGHLEDSAVGVAPAGPAIGPREATLPSFGQRTEDRTTLVAGAVIGISAAVGASTVRRGLRAAADAVLRR
jgi:membrane protein